MKAIIAAFACLLMVPAQSKEPIDLETTYQNLKKAVADKDPAQVKTLAMATHAAANEIISSKQPQDETERDAWNKHVAYAKEVDSYTEYALYSSAVDAEPAQAVDLLSTLEKQNSKSKYLDEGYGYYLSCLNKSGATAKVPGIAEKALANFPTNDDLLLVLASSAMEKQQDDRALTYANRLIAALGKRPKPENLSAADWEKQKNTELGQGYYMSGMVYAGKSQFTQANKNLRAALPLIQGNETMMAYALFQLGVANYQLGKMTLNRGQMLEGAKFSEQCAAIKSPLQSEAARNARVIRQEATGK
jgi:hypothetical protein